MLDLRSVLLYVMFQYTCLYVSNYNYVRRSLKCKAVRAERATWTNNIDTYKSRESPHMYKSIQLPRGGGGGGGGGG